MSALELVREDFSPLHGGYRSWPGPHYWACDKPEAPATVETIWDLRCRPCAIHAWAAIQNGLPNMSMYYDDALTGEHAYHDHVTFENDVREILAELHGVIV